MNTDIKHTGTVIEITATRVDVSILAESACASCKVKSACGMSESVDKVVSVIVDNPGVYSVGEQVTVAVGKGMGMKAVFLAYVIPFLLLLGTLMLLLELGKSEVTAGLVSVGVAALWYVVLWFFRNKIGREIVFTLEKE